MCSDWIGAENLDDPGAALAHGGNPEAVYDRSPEKFHGPRKADHGDNPSNFGGGDALIRKMVFEGVVDETLWESLRDIERAEGDNAQEGAAAQAGLEWMRGRHSFCW